MPAAQILLAAVCFGTTGSAQALGPSASPLAVGSARVAVGGLLLVLVGLIAARGSRTPWRRRELGTAAAAIALYQLTFFAAVDSTGVAVGTVVALGSAPVFAGLLGRAIEGEHLSGRWWGCTALAGLGVTLLVLGGGGGSAISAAGVALALTSGASYAAYTVMAKRMISAGDAPETVMGRSFGIAGLLLLPLLFVVNTGELATTDGLLLALYLGAIPTALAYVLFARGLRRVSAGEAATLTLAEPVTAAALGVLVLGERAEAAGIIGAALVLGSLLILAAPARAPERRIRPALELGLSPRLALAPVSTVDALVASLRDRILEGELAAGERLREIELTESYGVARHTVRSALRVLTAEGLVRIEPNRGARVASLSAEDLRGLYELRTALETEALRLALERHGGKVPASVHDAVRALSQACRRPGTSWTDIGTAHEGVHSALVGAAGSARLAEAHRALAGEMRLFVVQLKPQWTRARMARDHEQLVRAIERDGVEPLREHLREAAESVMSRLAAAG